jgi:hypothetical protein
VAAPAAAPAAAEAKLPASKRYSVLSPKQTKSSGASASLFRMKGNRSAAAAAPREALHDTAAAQALVASPKEAETSAQVEEAALTSEMDPFCFGFLERHGFGALAAALELSFSVTTMVRWV